MRIVCYKKYTIKYRKSLYNFCNQKAISKKEKPLYYNGFSCFGIIPTLALALDFSLKNALFDRFLFTKSRLSG